MKQMPWEMMPYRGEKAKGSTNQKPWVWVDDFQKWFLISGVDSISLQPPKQDHRVVGGL
ncbi:MAG: hypothetical protein CM15mV21_1230 [Eurybiavirus sp.]|nr:MAG: hypothetical protein CM15mV21_1230 [Eurybiavirus sp.]